MYKTLGGLLIRRCVDRLNAGDPQPLLRLFSDNAVLCFPGDNVYATQFRPVERGLEAHESHVGKAEIAAFLQRFTEDGIQMQIEDILMGGPPWHIRAAIRGRARVPAAPGTDDLDRYQNRAVMFAEISWGRIVRQEDYEDTERSAAFGATGTVQSLRQSAGHTGE